MRPLRLFASVLLVVVGSQRCLAAGWEVDPSYQMAVLQSMPQHGWFLGDGSEVVAVEVPADPSMWRLAWRDPDGQERAGWTPPLVSPPGWVFQQPSGRLVVIGGAATSAVRFDASGTLDPTFHLASVTRPTSVAMDAAGEIYSVPDWSQQQQPIVRYSTNGDPDPSFQPQTTGWIQGLWASPDGTLIVLEDHGGANGSGYELVRLRHDGSADASFRVPNSVLPLWGTIVTVLPDSSLLLASSTSHLAHLTREGVVDYDFVSALGPPDIIGHGQEVATVLYRLLGALGGGSLAGSIYNYDLDQTAFWVSADGRLRLHWQNSFATGFRRAAAGGSSAAHAHVVNFSTRVLAGGAAGSPILGLCVGGELPTPMLVRAVGPTLADFGVTPVLSAPKAVLRGASGSTTVFEGGLPDRAASMMAAGAFALRPEGREAVGFPSLSAGTYTAEISDELGGQGTVLVEAYDRTPWLGEERRLWNASTRGYVGARDQVMVAGFVVRGPGTVKLLVRGVGPTLTGFGVADALADPQIQVFQGTVAVAENDNWSTQTDGVSPTAIEEAAQAAHAFPIEPTSRDAAVLRDFSEGTYTVIVSGRSGATGTALVELYCVP